MVNMRGRMKPHSQGCRSGVISDMSCLHHNKLNSAAMLRSEKNGNNLHGDSPTSSKYQSSCLLMHVVFPARTIPNRGTTTSSTAALGTRSTDGELADILDVYSKKEGKASSTGNLVGCGEI